MYLLKPMEKGSGEDNYCPLALVKCEESVHESAAGTVFLAFRLYVPHVRELPQG